MVCLPPLLDSLNWESGGWVNLGMERVSYTCLSCDFCGVLVWTRVVSDLYQSGLRQLPFFVCALAFTTRSSAFCRLVRFSPFPRCTSVDTLGARCLDQEVSFKRDVVLGASTTKKSMKTGLFLKC